MRTTPRGTPGLGRGLPLTREALTYAKEQHAGQRRAADGAPFIAHPLEVAMLLQDHGMPDHVIAAGVLHDVLEKSDADDADLRERFGDLVADTVLAVSEDDGIDGYQERKAALREQVSTAGADALAVFAADKISKARELRLQAADERALEHYEDSLRLLERLMPESPLTAELRRELRQLPAARIV